MKHAPPHLGQTLHHYKGRARALDWIGMARNEYTSVGREGAIGLRAGEGRCNCWRRTSVY